MHMQVAAASRINKLFSDVLEHLEFFNAFDKIYTKYISEFVKHDHIFFVDIFIMMRADILICSETSI